MDFCVSHICVICSHTPNPTITAQFCQDFCLKSTALLTATQLGEIYLSIVPLHSVSTVQNSTQSARHNDASGTR